MSLKRMFTEHPAAVGETYLQHLGQASSFGFRMIFAGFGCLLHGLLPFAFVRTGSAAITCLHERMVVNRQRNAQANPAQANPVIPSPASR